ncbi:MAG: NAD-dependent epimerase/dehydratase family protein, partial [Elusimicrobia bacterium]|nr:NAD-dependent epimerase/dehydratase family protein [Elusimicrobiota bacterium]
HSAAVLRVVHAETYYDVNHAGTKNLIEATRQHNPKIKRFVYISSQAAMGPSESCAPRTASSNCAPVSDYGRSKLLGEEEALKFSDRIPVTILRPSAVYGPGDKDLLLFFRLANRGFFPVLSPCKGGECFVQLVFVDDIAEVCLLLLTRKPANTTYFVSQNTPYTWKQVGEIISRAVNKKLFFFKLPAGVLNLGATISETFMKLKGQPANLNRDKATELCQPYWIADSSITEKEFGFNFTPLEKGVEITYNWYRQNKWV